MTAPDPMQPPAELAPDATVTPTPTEAGACVFCPDGHPPFESRPWAVWLSGVRDQDGKHVALTVQRADGRHVAESDAVALRKVLRNITAAPSPAVSAPDLDAIRARLDRHTKGDDPSYYAGTVVADCYDLLAALAAAHAETERLRQWKAEALPVMAGLQDLGRVLGVGLGQSITGEAGAARARALVAERDEARAALARVEGLASRWDTLSGDMLRAALAATPSETEEGR